MRLNRRNDCIQRSDVFITICLKLNLKIRVGVDLTVNLMVLESNGIDVILGIDRLKKVAFLGHVNLKGGISVDPSKIQDVLSWDTTASVIDIRSFLGLAGYYQRFIE
jgi:hypothetical protein